MLGRGVVPDVGAAELAETYNVFQSGTDQPYPTEQMAIVLPHATSLAPRQHGNPQAG